MHQPDFTLKTFALKKKKKKEHLQYVIALQRTWNFNINDVLKMYC